MAYLENQSTTTRMELDEADAERGSMKSMEIDSHRCSRMGSY